MTQYIRHWLEQVNTDNGPEGITGLYGYDPSINSVTLFPSRYLGNLAFAVQLTTGAICRAGYALTAPTLDALNADCEVLQTFEVVQKGNGNVNSAFCCGARTSGTSVAWNGYFADVLFNNNLVAIRRGTAGVDATLGSAVKAISIAIGSLIHVRFRCRNVAGSPTTVQLQMRVWFDDAVEPLTWDVDCTDSGSSAFWSGSIMNGGMKKGQAADGLFTFTNWYASTGTGTATGTSAAPDRPKTRDEYIAFLFNQDEKIVVLSEFSVMAQDSSATEQTGFLCCSNIEFQAKPYDIYPNVTYEGLTVESPRLSRRLNDVMAGVATMAHGDLVIGDEIDPDSKQGLLDDWARYNFDGRSYKQLVGAPSWRRIDFKVEFKGLIQRVYRAGRSRLGFSLLGMDGMFQLPVHTELIGGFGPNAASVRPFGLGGFFNIKPPFYDAIARTYQVGEYLPQTNGPGPNENLAVRDGGIPLNADVRTITAVNIATNVITFDTLHAYQVGFTWVGTAPLPAGLTPGRKYYILTVPTTSSATLSLDSPISTSPTPSPEDLTDATTGGTGLGRAYDWDENGGRITPLNDPDGDITVDEPDDAPVISAAVSAIFTWAKTNNSDFPSSANGGFRPTTAAGSFAPFLATQVMAWWPGQRSVGECISDLISSIGGSLCISREGQWYLFQLTTPSGVSQWPDVVADDIKAWRQGERWPASFPERIGYMYNWTVQSGGDLHTDPAITPEVRDIYGREYTLAVHSPDITTDLSQPSNHLFATRPPDRVTFLLDAVTAEAESERCYNLRKSPTGTYLFETDAWAMVLELGDLLHVVYPSDGFAAGVDAYVVGLAEVASRGWVEVEIFVIIPDRFPVVTSTNPVVPAEFY